MPPAIPTKPSDVAGAVTVTVRAVVVVASKVSLYRLKFGTSMTVGGLPCPVRITVSELPGTRFKSQLPAALQLELTVPFHFIVARSYAKPFGAPAASVPDGPVAVCTVTATGPPAAAAGVTAVIFVSLTTTTEVAATPPIATDGSTGLSPKAPTLPKFCPVMVMAVPPAVGPFQIGR